MIVTLMPAEENEWGSLEKLGKPAGATSIAAVVETLKAKKVPVLRQSRASLVVDIEPGMLPAVMSGLEGWIAGSIKSTSNLSAYEGTLPHLPFGKKP